MIPTDQEWLKPLARKYLWWKALEEAVALPERVIAQVMNVGDYADVQWLVAQVGDEVLRHVFLFGPNLQPSEILKALVYYKDGDLTSLTPVEKLTVRDLPVVNLRSTSLSGLNGRDSRSDDSSWTPRHER